MKTITSIIMMFTCVLVSAQVNSSANDSIKLPWSFANAEKNIKFSPLEVISVIPTIGADLEVFLDKNISLQAGIGAIIPAFQHIAGSENNMFDKLGGYKLRAESKFFVFKKPSLYFSTEISLRHLIIRDEIGIGMEPSTQQNQWGEPQQTFAYFINTPMTFHRFTSGLSLKYGIERFFPNGFVFDFYTGLSIRKNYTRTWSEIPIGGTIPSNNGGLGWRLGDRVSRGYITPIIGIKLGFVF